MTKQGALINALCDKIEDMVGLIVTKSSEQSLDGETYQKLLRTGTSTFVRLRLLNRRLHEDKVALRSSVGELKRKIDSLALDLESEEREIAYIKHEIESTQKLETIYQTIGIIPEEEFLSSAPEEFLKDTDTPHKLMLSRLRYEIRQREMLVEAKNAARAKRDELRAAKRKRIDKLEAIDSHMKNYVKTISLLGKSLGIDSNDSKEQTDIEMMSPEDADVASGSKRSHAARDGTLSNIGTPRV
ncbi:THO complex subunit 5 [Dipsacomyces acuminosporus]|nr:THO complex subunit 5 [Dipsacomyces acuminosporus]